MTPTGQLLVLCSLSHGHVGHFPDSFVNQHAYFAITLPLFPSIIRNWTITHQEPTLTSSSLSLLRVRSVAITTSPPDPFFK